MAIPLFDKEVRVHQLLGDNPNTENSLSADEIKKKFDMPAEEIKEFINNVIVPTLAGLAPEASLIFVIGETRPLFHPVLWLDVSGQDDLTIGALKYIDANGTEFPFYPITKASSIADLQELKEEMKAQVKLVQSSAIVEAAYAKESTIHKLTAPAGSKNLKFSPTTPYEDGDVITYNGIVMTAKTQDGEPLSGGAWAAGAVVMCFISGNMLFFRGGGGGAGKSEIIVTAPTGSTVTATMGSVTKTAVEKNGTWTFKRCGIGSWLVKATHPNQQQPATGTVNITEDGQLMRYYITLAYRSTPEFVYTGDYEIVDDSDNPITDFANWKGNWKIRFLSSGDLTFTNLNSWDGKLDVFLVGGGGAGSDRGGGAGGYTTTAKQIHVNLNTNYQITVGSGGLPKGTSGGISTAFGASANGGNCAVSGRRTGANGGSGGGAGGTSGSKAGNGGSDGGNGSNGTAGVDKGGTGQGTTTREFGEPTGKLYAGGGGGGYDGGAGNGGAGGGGNGAASQATPGQENSGGGGGGNDSKPGANGGSGIVIIRDAR